MYAIWLLAFWRNKMLPKDASCDYSCCGNRVFKNTRYCILHCYEDVATREDDLEFKELFLEYLKCEVYGYLPQFIINSFGYYVSSDDFFKNDDVIDFLKSYYITICGIYFPKFIDLNKLNYLSLFKKIKFSGCYFNQKEIFVKDSVNCYYDCTFNSYIEKYFQKNILNMYDDYSDIFYRCKFKEGILLNGLEFLEIKINYLFNACIFEKKVIIKNSLINFDIFGFDIDININNDENINIRKFNNLEIKNCIFEKKITLNNLKIKEILIEDSIFKEKLEIKDGEFGKFEFKNSNVLKVFTAQNSKFVKFSMKESIFEDFAGFEGVHFGKIDNKVSAKLQSVDFWNLDKLYNQACFKKLKLIFCKKHNNEDKYFISDFTYTTFKSFSNFRDAKFYSGLDLSRINLKEQPNFFQTEISGNNTNRETFRIIKNSFDKNGNHIEANNYFSKEMKAYKKEKNSFLTQLILDINNLISEFGNNYIKPIFILILSMLYYNYILENQNYLYGYYTQFDFFINIEWFIIFLNNSAKNLLLFSNFLKEKQGMEFISLLFYIWFSVLIWQIVVAIKRHTIR